MPNLIGTGNNQVPTNGMLGGLAYQSPDNAVIKNLELTNLSGHNSLIPSTAVDVFVYDTRKDSDGGAWRKRTQHTSWYTETLNTATRGSRRDFPAVAVIVATASSVTIYDGDDPDMPMWMVFNTTDGSLLRSGQITSISMLNAELWVGHASGSGVHWVNFLKDTARWLTASSSYGGFFIKRDISRRNESGSNYYNNVGGASDITIAGSSINDVAMTVLPNAPIDSTTGLPIPTIAVATEGGVSVIRDNGTVISQAHSYGTSMRIDVNNSLLLATHNGRTGGQNAEVIDLITLTQIGDKDPSPVHADNNVGTNENDYGYGVNSGANYMPFQLPDFGSTINPLIKGLDLYFGRNFLIHLYEERNAPANTMSNFITTTYNTGWMHGNCKGAFLSDTSTASVTGIELNQYGDFSSTTGWGSRSASWTISGGVASVSSGAGYQLLGVTSGTLTNGRKYAVTVNVTAFTAGRLEFSQANSSNIPFTLGSTGTKTLIFTYTGTTGYALGIYGYGDASYGFTIDDLYIRELSEADRSVNNTGLAVYGTLTKTPVATGSNLVAYGGFDASNYLYQPHSSSLSFGTNDFCVTYWYKNIAGDEINIQKNTRGADGWRIVAGNASDDLYIVNGNFSAYGVISGISNKNVWNHWVIIRKYNSGWYIYKNGVYAGVISSISGSNFNEVSPLTVGSNTPTSNLMSLVRISQSVPSPEQILKIYNDEKALFQPNSQCTLFGSSDTVTALAYDDTTKLLHVGTPSGRSDFQGLERINNTTTAVTTAINASNGLIAEQ